MIALRFLSPLELLVSVMLSAQTTDVNVNRVTERLFRKYRKPEDYLAVPPEELERDIFATGFYRQKAKSIRGTMRMLLDDYGGEVPRSMEELLRLPGVARKTANVVASELGQPQGIVVDTHVRRLSQRLGLTRHEDPVKIERDLMRLVPREEWGRFPHLLIWHGTACVRRAPSRLRALRAQRPVPVEPGGRPAAGARRVAPRDSASARRQRDEQAAVGVVGREEVGGDLLLVPGSCAHAQPLAEPAHAPLARQARGVLAVLEAAQAEALHQVVAHQVAVAIAGELEDTAADREDAARRVADDHARRGRRVVVVHELEEEPETAAAALNLLLREALETVRVDRAVLAVRADVERHA